MLSLIVLLAACGTKDVVVSSEFPGCENYDPDHPPKETLEAVEDGLNWNVVHYGVFEACSATFEPEIQLDGRSIDVREVWTGGEDDTCTSCFTPMITIKDPPKGKYEVYWYTDDGDVPWDNVSFKVE